jgi:hypothetical protein
VLAAAEVDQPLGAVDERGEQVRRDDVDRQDVRAGVDAGVVDDRVHPAEAVHVAGETGRLLEVGEVADDGRSAPVQEVAHGREPAAVASVDDDLVPVVEQRVGSRPSETVCGAGDEDACHISGGERAAGEWLCRLRRTPLVGQHQHHWGAAVGQCWWTWTSQSSGAVRQFP